MKQALLIPALVLALLASAASASACTAEYKAKRTSPTEYKHATMSVPADQCTKAGARAYVAAQLKGSGWTLLSIVKVSN